MSLKLVHYPDPALLEACPEVTVFDEALDKEIEEMQSLMIASKGIGLAANQCGLNKAMFVMSSKGTVYEFINPKFVSTPAGHQLIEEGCLSLPGVLVTIERAAEVVVEAKNKRGETFEVVATGLEAVCIQHEMEHLRGKFFLDSAPRQQRRAAMKKLGLK